MATLPSSNIKDGIDMFLKRKGFSGIDAVLECIKRNFVLKRVRYGKSDKLICTIVEGKRWFINEKFLDDPKEMGKCLMWLGCMEVGVPRDLSERLMDEIDKMDEELDLLE